MRYVLKLRCLIDKKYSSCFWVILFSAWALYLRFKCLAARELWGDELFQIQQTQGPLKPFWERQMYGDFTSFPGDYLLTYPFVQIFGLNKWGLVIPHLLATILGFYFLFRIGERYFRTVLGFIVTFAVISFNQHLIFHSFELRPYAVLPALALGVFYYLDILFNDPEMLNSRKKFLIGLFLIFTIWFHAYGILIVFYPLAFFMLTKRKDLLLGGEYFRDLRIFFTFVFSIALPVWFWYALADPSGRIASRMSEMDINTFTYIANPLNGFGHFFNYVVFYHLIGFKPLYFLLGALILLIFVPFQNKLNKIGFFLVMIILPIETILFMDLHVGYWFLIRQYIYLAPFLALFLGWLWDSSLNYYLDKTQRKRTFFSVVGIILMVGCLAAGSINLIMKALG